MTDLIVPGLVGFVGGCGLGWFCCRISWQRAYHDLLFRTTEAWIHFKRPDVPPLGPYRATEPNGDPGKEGT